MLVLLAVALGSIVQPIGWTQSAHFALVRALADGTSVIDAYHEETCDKSFTDGHYYAAKAPGLAFLALPPYVALDSLGLLPGDGTTDERARAIWLLGLPLTVLPALVLFLVSARLAGRVAPGTGLAVGATVVAATLVLPFATLLFSHVLAAALVLGSFALLWRERLGARWALVAGALAGYAVTSEHHVALVAAALGVYALARGGPRAAAAFGAGGLAGLAPLGLYNHLSFGSVTHFAVTDAVVAVGGSCENVVGAVDEGFFGAVAPSLHPALELLASRKGLLALTPVVAAGIAGLVLLWRRGFRYEAAAAGSALAVLFLWNSGLTGPYGGPFGGDSPGPRYLIAALPLLAPGLALAYRAAFLPTAGLAAVSLLLMGLATSTQPMLGDFDTIRWVHRAAAGEMTGSVFGSTPGEGGWGGVALFWAGLAVAAAVAAASARPRLERSGLFRAAGVLAAWVLLALAAPPLLERGHTAVALIAVAAAVAGGAAAAGASTSLARRGRPREETAGPPPRRPR